MAPIFEKFRHFRGGMATVGPEGAQGLQKDTKMEPKGTKMEPQGLPNRGFGPQNCGEKGARVSSFQMVNYSSRIDIYTHMSHINSPMGLLLQHFICFAKFVDSVYVSGPFKWLVKQRARNEIAFCQAG